MQDPNYQPLNPALTSLTPQRDTSKPKSFIKYTILAIFVLSTATLGWLYYQENQKLNLEKQKVADYQQATQYSKEIIETIESKVYRQFELVDQNGHGIATEICMQVVAALNYKDTKPEYQRLVANGSCNSHSDVFKPNYEAFTPTLQDKTSKLNEILTKLGDQNVPNFEGRPTNNYIKDAYPYYNGNSE